MWWEGEGKNFFQQQQLLQNLSNLNFERRNYSNSDTTDYGLRSTVHNCFPKGTHTHDSYRRPYTVDYDVSCLTSRRAEDNILLGSWSPCGHYILNSQITTSPERLQDLAQPRLFEFIEAINSTFAPRRTENGRRTAITTADLREG